MGKRVESVKSLRVWLEIATKDLCEISARRIYSEIRDHYGAAAEKELESGCTPAVAAENALAALGSPNEAARHFRKRHLTKEEHLTISRGFTAKGIFGHSLTLASLTILPTWFWIHWLPVGTKISTDFRVFMGASFIVALALSVCFGLFLRSVKLKSRTGQINRKTVIFEQSVKLAWRMAMTTVWIVYGLTNQTDPIAFRVIVGVFGIAAASALPGKLETLEKLWRWKSPVGELG